MASASDSFQRADGVIGGNWTVVSGSFTVSASQALQRTTGGSYRSAVYSATPPDGNDTWVAASMNTSNSSFGRGVNIRASSTAVTDYRLMGYGGDLFYLEYMSAGATTTLDTGGVCTAGTTYYIALTASGSAIAGSRNGTADVSANHATLTTGGWGLGAYGGSTVYWMDTWSASDLGGGGGGASSVSGRAALAYVARGAENCGAPEAGRAVVSYIARGAENRSVPEAGRAVLAYVGRGAENRSVPEAGRAVLTYVGRGAENRSVPETGRGVLTYAASGAENRGATDAGRATLGLVASCSADLIAVDAGRGVFALRVSGAEVLAALEAGRSVLAYVASGTASQPGGDDQYIVAGRAVMGFRASGADVMAYADTGAGVMGYVGRGQDTAGFVDVGTVVLTLRASVLDTAGMVDGGRAVLQLVASGTASVPTAVTAGSAAYTDLVRQKGEKLITVEAILRAKGERMQ